MFKRSSRREIKSVGTMLSGGLKKSTSATECFQSLNRHDSTQPCPVLPRTPFPNLKQAICSVLVRERERETERNFFSGQSKEQNKIEPFVMTNNDPYYDLCCIMSFTVTHQYQNYIKTLDCG